MMTTICTFRQLLERHDLCRQLVVITRKILSNRGLMIKEDTIVDATSSAVPSMTKNASRQRDPR